MIISKNKSLKELQEQFCKIFPGLKIEFYRHPNEGYDGPYNLLHYDLDTIIEKINPELKEVRFKLNDTDLVGDFEEKLSSILGFDVQVFRRSKELWLQTTKTDKWTLERQNLKGLHSLEPQKV